MMDKTGVAYCGIYCSECFAHTGHIADLARDLRSELRKTRFEKIASGIPFKEFEHYTECYEVLGALVKLRCRNGCREGGGNPFRKIRKCVQKKGIDGCWECEDFSSENLESCEKLSVLSAGHGEAHIRNLKIIRKKGIKGFIDGKKYWYT
jgi:hypothetical protein